ncbi:hypothetical protein, partial [Klebsiella pneumoniae]|uniref:hypothetical protein n=1 Tax=Klebsiella pneumoniae TaxID=573 RepID=UPI0015B99F5C
MTLDMLNVMLAVSEEGMIEEMLLALLASPQLAVFFEKFPRLKNMYGSTTYCNFYSHVKYSPLASSVRV